MRLVSTPDRTGGLLEALACDPGVSSLVVLPGAARRPDGDAVAFDVRSGSANSVFRNLKTFTDGHRDGVAVEYVDATVGEQPAPASKHLVLQRDLAPVWDLVEARIRSDAVYAGGGGGGRGGGGREGGGRRGGEEEGGGSGRARQQA